MGDMLDPNSTNTHIYIHIHTYTCTHIHIHTYKCTHTYMHPYKHTLTRWEKGEAIQRGDYPPAQGNQHTMQATKEMWKPKRTAEV